MMADTRVAFPSPNPEDYAPGATECAWYAERKASGSVVECKFPSTTFLVVAGVGLLALMVLGRS